MKRKPTAFILSVAVCLSAVSGTMFRTDSYVCGASAQYASLQWLYIANKKDTIALGETVQLVPDWGNGDKSTITYTSDNENVVTVDETGLVTAVGEGRATVTATAEHSDTPRYVIITVDKNVKKSIYYNVSDLKLGDKLYKYDTIHNDDKRNIYSSVVDIVNSKGSYDSVSFGKEDYVLPFYAEVVGISGNFIDLAPDVKGVKYVDARTLSVGDTIDQSAHLLCYDYHVNGYQVPVVYPKYYKKYFGYGDIKVTGIDHKEKTITLEAQQESLEKYTWSYDTLKSVKSPMFSGDQVLLTGKVATRVVQVSSWEGEGLSDRIEWEISGTAETEIYIEGTQYGDMSHDTGDAIDYCIITAKTPGTVRVEGKYFADPGRGGAYLSSTYLNFTTDQKGIFKKDYTDEKIAPDGDINGSGKAEAADVITLKKWLLNTSDIKLGDWKMGDLNDDGKLNVIDLLMMKKKVLVSEVPDKMPYIRDASGQITSDMKNMLLEKFTS